MIPAMYGQMGDQLVHAAAAAALAQTATQEPVGRDTMLTKIFVGGLPYHTSDKTLHEYFEQFGEIEEAVVITDRQTQKSRGYGFVTMKDKPSAERACKDPNPIIDGRKANVNLAYLGAKPRTNVQLAALGNQVQLPLQAQLQALFPARLGLPQFYYPTAASAATGLVNPLLTAAAAAAAGPAAQQQLIDYNALVAAVSNQNAAYGLAPQGKYAVPVTAAPTAATAGTATGLDHYGYAAAGYGLMPGTYTLQNAQLAAAQQQIEHQRRSQISEQVTTANTYRPSL